MMRRSVISAALAAPGIARAATGWQPSRPIQLVTPFAPGGASDLISRLLAPHLSATLGVPVIVENRSGAATQIGTAYVARARPDGHTILLTTAAFAINAGLFSQLPYDPVTDFAPLTMVMTNPQLLVVSKNSPVSDVNGLLAAARAKPGGLNFGSAAPGSMGHLSMELLASRTGAPLSHVSYRSSAAALTDLIGGQIDGMFDNPSTALPFVRDGALRAVAFTGPERSQAAPEVPTMIEQGQAGFTSLNWYALFAPAQTPSVALSRLHEAAGLALQDAALVERMAKEGTDLAPSTSAVLGSWVKSEIATWTKVIRERDIRPG
ncbi:Bug family tripartite tricarboxylate transporter substrate binding protein [Roseomonas sp. WA12]